MAKGKILLSLALGLIFVQVHAQTPMLADRHVQRGIKCEKCHAQGMKNLVTQQDCLICHGGSYEKLAEKTADSDINPHATHMGEVACTDCHQGHKAPRLVCDQCHEFKDMLKVP